MSTDVEYVVREILPVSRVRALAFTRVRVLTGPDTVNDSVLYLDGPGLSDDWWQLKRRVLNANKN